MTSETISVIALLFSVAAAIALALATGREARRRWGWPIPGIRVQVPNTNGRWKLDWSVVLVFWAMAARDGWVAIRILHLHPRLDVITVALYLATAGAKLLVYHLLIHDRRHLAGKGDPHA